MAAKKNTRSVTLVATGARPPRRRRAPKKANKTETLVAMVAGGVVGALGSAAVAAKMSPEAGTPEAADPKSYPWGYRNPGVYVAAGAGLAIGTGAVKDPTAQAFLAGAAAGAAGYAVLQESARMAYDADKAKGPAAYSLSLQQYQAEPKSPSAGLGYDRAGEGAQARLAAAAERIHQRVQGLAMGTPSQVMQRMDGLAMGTPDDILGALPL